MNKTNSKLLWILAVLLLVRFGFEPLWLWQSEQSAQLERNMQRAARVELLLARYASPEEQLQQLNVLKQTSQQGFPHTTQEQYRLQLQQQLQQLLADKGVQMELFDWVAEQQVGQTALTKAIIQMQWIGKTSQVVAAHSDIDAMANMQVTSMQPTWFETLRPETELKTAVELEVYYVSQPE